MQKKPLNLPILCPEIFPCTRLDRRGATFCDSIVLYKLNSATLCKYAHWRATAPLPNPSRSNPTTHCHSSVPARCHPNDRVVVAGFVAIHKANNEIIKPAKSDIKCAASVTIARLLAKYPPEIMMNRKNYQ